MTTAILKYLKEGMIDVDNPPAEYEPDEHEAVTHATHVITSKQNEFPGSKPVTKGVEWKFLDIEDLGDKSLNLPADVNADDLDFDNDDDVIDISHPDFQQKFDVNEAVDLHSALEVAAKCGKMLELTVEGETVEIDPWSAKDIVSVKSKGEIEEAVENGSIFDLLNDVLLEGFEDIEDVDYDEPEEKVAHLGGTRHGLGAVNHLKGSLDHKRAAKTLVHTIAAIKKHFPNASPDAIKRALESAHGRNLIDKVADNVHGGDLDDLDLTAELGVDRFMQNKENKFRFGKHMTEADAAMARLNQFIAEPAGEHHRVHEEELQPHHITSILNDSGYLQGHSGDANGANSRLESANFKGYSSAGHAIYHCTWDEPDEWSNDPKAKVNGNVYISRSHGRFQAEF